MIKHFCDICGVNDKLLSVNDREVRLNHGHQMAVTLFTFKASNITPGVEDVEICEECFNKGFIKLGKQMGFDVTHKPTISTQEYV